MPDARWAIVTNTTPLIALAAATGELEILQWSQSNFLLDRI